jgi:hypothetical protein
MRASRRAQRQLGIVGVGTSAAIGGCGVLDRRCVIRRDGG